MVPAMPEAVYVPEAHIMYCSFLNCSEEKGCMGEEVGWEGITGT
jgi:hypothetical protein